MRVLGHGRGRPGRPDAARDGARRCPAIACHTRSSTSAHGEAVRGVRAAACGPAVIINAAAYTAVDKAESEPELARRIKPTGRRHLAARPASMARACSTSPPISSSTDGRTPPYRPAIPHESPERLRHDQAGRASGRARSAARSARSSCEPPGFTPRPGSNFLRTMLRLMGANARRPRGRRSGGHADRGALAGRSRCGGLRRCNAGRPGHPSLDGRGLGQLVRFRGARSRRRGRSSASCRGQ